MSAVKLATCLFVCAVVGTLVGCSPKDNVEISDVQTPYASREIDEPDFVVVEKFLIDPEQIRAMKVWSPELAEQFAAQTLTDKERQLGEMVANELQMQLIAQLNARDIKAYDPSDAPQETWKTGVIRGFFFEVNEGNAPARYLIGFGLGQQSISTRVYLDQRQVTISEATVTTKTELKPGLLPVISIADDALMGHVKNDAKRAAIRIADAVLEGYQRRGWREAPAKK